MPTGLRRPRREHARLAGLHVDLEDRGALVFLLDAVLGDIAVRADRGIELVPSRLAVSPWSSDG